MPPSISVKFFSSALSPASSAAGVEPSACDMRARSPGSGRGRRPRRARRRRRSAARAACRTSSETCPGRANVNVPVDFCTRRPLLSVVVCANVAFADFVPSTNACSSAMPAACATRTAATRAERAAHLQRRAISAVLRAACPECWRGNCRRGRGPRSCGRGRRSRAGRRAAGTGGRRRASRRAPARARRRSRRRNATARRTRAAVRSRAHRPATSVSAGAVGRTVARAELAAFAVRLDRAGVRRAQRQQQRRQRQCAPSRRSPVRIHASALLAGTSTSRLPFDCIGDTRPARSICSIRRAARL